MEQGSLFIFYDQHVVVFEVARRLIMLPDSA